MKDYKKVGSVALLWSSFGPYHVARIQAANQTLKERDIQVFACRFSEKSDTYAWRPEIPDGIPIITLGEREPQGVWDCVQIAILWANFLQKNKISVAFLPSYSPLPNFLCWLVTFVLGVKRVIMTESWAATGRAKGVSNLIKQFCVKRSNGALVGGINQREYMISMGMNEKRIADGYDVVDVAYFRSQSEYWLNNKESDKRSALPSRYFLSLGRLVAKKNLYTLIKAYSMSVDMAKSDIIPLVIVGEGADRVTLIQQAESLGLTIGFPSENPKNSHAEKGEVLFYPFQQIETTPLFFTHCEAFILPSLWEEWGLVINEAMACGAPILVSRQVGCARDLVKEGQNGFLFDPKSPEDLSSYLTLFLNDPSLSSRLGKISTSHIASWGKERFGQGVMQLVDSLYP